VPIYLIGDLAYACTYFLKFGIRKSKSDKTYLFPVSLICLSHFLSSFTSLEGASNEFFRAFGYCFNSLFLIFLIQKNVTTKKDIVFLLKGFTLAFCFASIYGIVEYFQESNPLLSYKSSLTPEGLDVYEIDPYRGYRISSIFEHPIGAGMNFSLFIFFAAFCLSKKDFHLSMFWGLSISIVVLLCFICVFLTKMRSSILFLLIGAIGFLNFKKPRTFVFLSLLLIVFIIGVIYVPQIQTIFLSLFNSEARNSVGGSSLEMRIEQSNAVFKIFNISPFTGLGERFMDYLSERELIGTYSFESVWFEVACKFGLLGLLATAFLILYSVFYVPLKKSAKELFFISLGYWVVYSFSSTPFFRETFYYLILICILKFRSGLLCVSKKTANTNYKQRSLKNA
jgi:hypothetical protein